MNRIVLLLLLTLSFLLQGCAAEPAPATAVAEWRQGVERYVWEQGNGDPAVLRDVSWDDVHPGFATLGDPLPDRSTDVYGLLVAHPSVAHHAYFVFLVAIVHNEVIEHMLPVALEIDAGKFRWVEGLSDDRQMRRYIDWQNLEHRSTRFRFPARDDSFDLSTEANAISIAHEQSGATWRVELPVSSDGITASPPTDRPVRRNGAAPDPPAAGFPYPPPQRGAAQADTSSTRP
jgi:hypothetical protein